MPSTQLAMPLTVALLLSSTLCAEPQAEWPRWRGPLDKGSIEVGNYPVQFAPDNVHWSTPLPGKGCSTPIVLKRTIYLTAPVEGKDAVIAFDWDGVCPPLFIAMGSNLMEFYSERCICIMSA